jgi:drug/metabolite transporter (DMT)-like permease
MAISNTTRGIVYMLVASVFFAMMALFTKLLATIPIAEIIFFRALMAAVLCMLGVWRLGISPWGNDKLGLVVRGFAGCISLAQGFWLLHNIPLGAASTLTHLSPIFTTLLGIWMVREKVTWLQMACFVLSFIGVVLIQGFDYRISLWHLLIGISASFCMGLAYSSVRRLGKTEHPLVIMLYFPMICIPLSAVAMCFDFVMPSSREWLYLVLLGLTAQVGQYCMTVSYQVAAISKVAIVSYSEVIFSIVLGLVLFGENFNLLTYGGMALVAAGVVMNIGFNSRTKNPKQDNEPSSDV